MTRDSVQVDLAELIDLFYKEPASIGRFVEVAAEEIPAATRRLLDHQAHMTVTVERYHGCPVDVNVLQSQIARHWYAREILLRRSSDQGVVQYGIVRLNLDLLVDSVRAEILQGNKPLGRVLIEHDVLRSVRLLSLQKIAAGPVLQRWFGVGAGQLCYGRTAIIFCDDQPAIQLLEIVPSAD